MTVFSHDQKVIGVHDALARVAKAVVNSILRSCRYPIRRFDPRIRFPERQSRIHATASSVRRAHRGGTVYDGTGATGGRADVGIRGDRIAPVGDLGRRASATGRRRDRARGRARLHQHAVVGHRVAAPGRALAERHPPGRDDRDFRRGHLDGPGQRRDAGRAGPGAWATSSSTSPGRRSRSISSFSRRRACRRTSRRLSVPTTIREYVLGLEDRKPTPWSSS